MYDVSTLAKIVTGITHCLRSLYLHFDRARNFVNLLRSPGVDSQPGGIDFFESNPGLLKIRAQYMEGDGVMTLLSGVRNLLSGTTYIVISNTQIVDLSLSSIKK
jgi:hypothetical protein